MNQTTDELMEMVLALPEPDRIEIAEALLASLMPEDRPPLDEAWAAEIERRSEELRSGKVKGVPWEEVRRRARERTGG